MGHVLDHMRVADAMQRDAIVLSAGLSVAEAVDLVRNLEFTTFPVVDELSHCVGSVTEMRLRRTLVNKNGTMTIRDIADPCQTVFADQPLSEAVIKMDAARVRQLSVLEHGNGHKIIGIVTMSDIVRVQAEAIAENERVG
jgi:CBS domain-containing protein